MRTRMRVCVCALYAYVCTCVLCDCVSAYVCLVLFLCVRNVCMCRGRKNLEYGK